MATVYKLLTPDGLADDTAATDANIRFIAAARDGWPHAIRRAMDAEARVAELEAACAAMREALADLAGSPRTFDDERLKYVEIQVPRAALDDAAQALSSDAGAKLLARLQAAERVVEAAQILRDTCGEGWDQVWVNLEQALAAWEGAKRDALGR